VKPVVIKVKDVENQTEKAANAQPAQFADELSEIRNQLKDHYESQIKALVKEIHSQKEVLEVYYSEKHKKLEETFEEKLKAAKQNEIS